MSFELIAALVLGFLIVIPLVLYVYVRLPKKLKTDAYMAQWKDIQACCKDKACWGDAVVDADKLLNTALKRKKLKGKSMGERMVSAQRLFTDNDAVWFAHNLAKKIMADPAMKLREDDVKTALIGFRQALRDIGALEDASRPKDS